MAVLENILGGALSEALGAALYQAVRRDSEAKVAAICRKWEESFQDPSAGDDRLNKALEWFFSLKPVRDELMKVMRDQYDEVKLDVLARGLRESFKKFDCRAPKRNLEQRIDARLRELKAMLEANPAYRKEYQIGVQRAVREGGGRQAAVANATLAANKYRESVVRQHRRIQFAGFAEVGGQLDVEMARVFVTPRLAEQKQGKESQPIRADDLLTRARAPQRLMILGGPGSGKTTLLEALALGFARGVDFGWAGRLPKLEPVFYRIRDLDKDLEKPSTIWDAMHHRCCESMSLNLPHDFFERRMKESGLVVLFDGLDEASSLAQRIRIVDSISEFAANLAPGSRVIVTSRPHDYRHRFEAAKWRHYELCEFNDEEIQSFIRKWREIHEPDRAKAVEKGERLWGALEKRKDILRLARNALLLTMIVRVHFVMGALPDSRLGLYAKCTETLLKDWVAAKDLEPSPIDYHEKHKLLERLAYEMQSEEERLSEETSLQIGRAELARHLARYLRESGNAGAAGRVDEVIDRLHARDAVLVQFGTDARGQDPFGFVHRSFQEYFAAAWMASELSEKQFQGELDRYRDGWHETLCLAVAQLPDRRRRQTLLNLVKTGRAEFAVACLSVAPPEAPWLRLLVQFLSKYTWGGREYEGLKAGECADACAGREETGEVLRAMFEPDNREGRSLAAAVELAEELAQRGDGQMHELVEGFFAEAEGLPEDMVEVPAGAFLYGKDLKCVEVPAFRIGRYPVTNAEYERMIPGHKKQRDQYSDQDTQPVIDVSWYEARLYCRWRGGRLPTEEEWEKAASWDEANQRKRRYPWGDEFDPKRCNTTEGGPGRTTPVGSYPEGRSAYGCEDMEGNVLEWTKEGALRGGAWYSDRDFALCAYRRGYWSLRLRFTGTGFRCART